MIEIFGKENCGICDAAKDKMERMKIPYGFHNVDEFTEVHEGWREDGSVDRVALLSLNNVTIPTIVIEGKPYTYTEAMKLLKSRKNDARKSD